MATPTFIPPSEARLQRLLSRGYFPSELPPPFTSFDFGRHAPAIASELDLPKISKFWTKPEQYSVPRYGHARRALAIVNPVNQLLVSQIIASNWLAIRKRLKRSKITEFDPQIVLKGPGRAVTGVDFDGVARRKAELLANFGRYVKTDVARFYPSVYTHAIPWSLVGKEFAKANHNDKVFKSSFANQLDKAVGAGQQGQTIGIPIGPDTSRIISELIAVEVEEIVRTHLPDLDNRAVRYVDDILIGLNDHETPSAVLSALSLALYEYELELNAEKTVTLGLGCAHAPEWINYIRTFELNSRAGRQRDDLDSYFEQALFLADANPRENVLLFAAKRAASFNVDQSNISHLVRWLLYSSRRAPSCLSFVAEHLAATASTHFLPDEEIESFILQQLPLKAEAVHTDEVAWLLFWAREIGLKLPVAAFEKVTKLRSSAVGLITLDLRERGQIDGKLTVTEWRKAATTDGLKSELWLIAYEATKKGWWKGKCSSNFITGHPFFAAIWNKEIEFYDPKKRARKRVSPTFLRTALSSGAGWGSGEYPV